MTSRFVSSHAPIAVSLQQLQSLHPQRQLLLFIVNMRPIWVKLVEWSCQVSGFRNRSGLLISNLLRPCCVSLIRGWLSTGFWAASMASSKIWPISSSFSAQSSSLHYRDFNMASSFLARSPPSITRSVRSNEHAYFNLIYRFQRVSCDLNR